MDSGRTAIADPRAVENPPGPRAVENPPAGAEAGAGVGTGEEEGMRAGAGAREGIKEGKAATGIGFALVLNPGVLLQTVVPSASKSVLITASFSPDIDAGMAVRAFSFRLRSSSSSSPAPLAPAAPGTGV